MSSKNNGKIDMIKRVLLIVSIFFSTIICILVTNFIFVTEFKVTDVGKEQSPNGEYFAEFQMIGEPAWPFGPTKTKIIIKSEKVNFIKEITILVDNDGGRASSDNWVVNWSDDTVEIIVNGNDRPGESRFNFTLE